MTYQQITKQRDEIKALANQVEEINKEIEYNRESLSDYLPYKAKIRVIQNIRDLRHKRDELCRLIRNKSLITGYITKEREEQQQEFTFPYEEDEEEDLAEFTN